MGRRFIVLRHMLGCDCINHWANFRRKPSHSSAWPAARHVFDRDVINIKAFPVPINKYIIQQSLKQWQHFYFICHLSFAYKSFRRFFALALRSWLGCEPLWMDVYVGFCWARPIWCNDASRRLGNTARHGIRSAAATTTPTNSGRLWKNTHTHSGTVATIQTVQIIFDSLSSNGMINATLQKGGHGNEEKKNSSSNMMKQSWAEQLHTHTQARTVGTSRRWRWPWR